MALNSITKKSNQGRDIKYLNKDFSSFRENLIEYAQTYFPQTYSDFNEASPGMMFIEMAAYLGDVLSYYTDDTLKESLMLYADDRSNVVDLANYLGYKPKVISPALVKLSVYQLVPSKRTILGSGNDYEPDSDYYLRIKEGMLCEGPNSIVFRTTELLDFSSDVEREITVYSKRTTDSSPEFYLVKKYVNAISGQIRTLTKDFGTTPRQFSEISIGDTDVIQIYDVRDSSGNKWYEVPYLAQEMVFVDYPTTEQTDKDLVQFKDSVPSILKLTKTSRRFTTKINSDNTTTLIFGGGNSTQSDESLIPNFKNVGLGLNSSIDKLGASFDPANFLKTTTYGQAPTGEFTISYLKGGGVQSNVPVRTINRIQSISFDDDTASYGNNATMYQRVKNSIAIDNEFPATGGKGPETIEEIRENALANFGSQNRAVTRKDYQVRALSLPAKFGGIAKAYCAPDGELDNNSPASILANPDALDEFTGLVQTLKQKNLSEKQIKDEVSKFLLGKKNNVAEKNNPFAINLYVLGYDANKTISTLNKAIKENLKTYLSEYRLLTDGVNILDGFVINIGVDFEIRTYGGYNKREVLTKCITQLQDYFNIDNWTFNMPINISEIELLIAGVEGVQSVPKCEIVNKCLGSYSKHSYNISSATKGKMVYPSLDPSIFEVKFPNKDIKGRVI
jgi:hypothetical protein